MLAGIILLISDIISFYLSLTLAYYIRKEIIESMYPSLPHLGFHLTHFLSIWWFPSIIIALFIIHKMYSQRLSFWDEIKEIIRIHILSMFMIFSIVYLTKIVDNVSRSIFLLYFPISVFIFIFMRSITKKIMYILNIWKTNAIIYGAGEAGIATLKGLLREKHMGYNSHRLYRR